MRIVSQPSNNTPLEVVWLHATMTTVRIIISTVRVYRTTSWEYERPGPGRRLLPKYCWAGRARDDFFFVRTYCRIKALLYPGNDVSTMCPSSVYARFPPGIPIQRTGFEVDVRR